MARALAEHGEDAGRVNEDTGGPDGEIWSIEVTPRQAGAASVCVSHSGGDEIWLGFGETSANLWDSDPYQLAAFVEEILAGVFAGRIAEAGCRNAGCARVIGKDGRTILTIHLGAVHLPLPWRFRRRRTYQPYS